MFQNNCNFISKNSYDTVFDMEAYLNEVRIVLPDLDETDTWIHSGIYIGEKFKPHISSYRLLGSQKPSLGHSRIEVLLVKTQIGVSLADTESLCIDFISNHLLQTGTDAAIAALIPSNGAGWCFFFVRSPKHCGVKIPEDILAHICTGTIKNYLKKTCGLSDAAIEGYFSAGYSLFDDSIIRSKAREIDKALHYIKFCDIALGSGQMVRAMAELITQLRLNLNKYLGSPSDRTYKSFKNNFLFHSLYAADYDAGSLEIIKTELRLESESENTISDDHFVWGNILIEDLFSGIPFDVLATNPPHMRQDEFSFIKNRLEAYSSFRRNADLYCYYAERAFGIVREGGSVGLLMSNRWMRSDYGSGLRGFLSGRKIYEMIDYGNIPPVDGISTPMSVIIAADEPPSGSIRLTSVESTDYESLSMLVEDTYVPYEPSRLGEERWVFGSDNITPLINKISSAGIPLGKYIIGGLYRGLLTGLNEAFAVDKWKKEELIKEDGSSAQILRPFLSGRNVKRYAVPEVKKYLLYLPKGMTDKMRGEMEPWEWFSSAYPAVAAHLKKFEKRAAARKDSGDYWWELRSCRYYAEFEKTKIICPTIVKHISATMDADKLFSNDKTTIILTDDFYILGLLNSSLMDFYVRRISMELLNGHFEIKPADLALLPIRKISPTKSFHVDLADEIRNCAMKLSKLCSVSPKERTEVSINVILEQERLINRAVYRLYKLTPAEISLVENY